ncbi:MAG: DUF4388 domain-containing protein [Acidobacteria bacterium]|uniref:DUF4388 domain-containing protein n=1 Tax=Candidatus Polarisedimenticola svalbardensis TaxID=2886004 RepID=A0A8J6XZI3_9BACT|nr:DUF4388 domain-containing protein [Candidatus Polarisedimenticola svalbardensis]
MALYGDFRSFPVTDLLQWVESSRKTGVIEIEQRHIKKAIVCREGRIVACTSDDPSTRLGQSLLAQRKITESQLQDALAVHEASGKILGEVLVESGMVTLEVVVEHVAAKAEEAIYGLFDQEDAFFRFDENGEEPVYLVAVDLNVQEILLKGLKRYDEMNQMREVFTDPGVILARTMKDLPAGVSGSRASLRLLQAVDGERTLEEILLHTRGSEYLVTRFLFQLFRSNLLEIRGMRPVAPLVPSDQPQNDSRSETGSGVSGEIELAGQLMERGEHDAAIAVLEATSRAWPGAPTVRQMISRAEAEYFEKISQLIPSSAVPIMDTELNELACESLSPGEAYLTTLIDGVAEIKSIQWIAPMRALDVLRNLQRLLDRGMIRLVDRQPLDPAASLPEDDTRGGVHGGER